MLHFLGFGALQCISAACMGTLTSHKIDMLLDSTYIKRHLPSLVPPGPLFNFVLRGPGMRSHVTLDTN